MFCNTALTNLIYVAGFFDGEGCISAAKRRKSQGRSGVQYVLCVSACNTNEHVIRFIHSFFGVGSVILTHKERSLPLWRWSIQQGRARDVLVKLAPHLRVKKPQAEIAIALWNGVDAYVQEASKRPNYLRALPQEEVTRRDTALLELSSLKRSIA